MNLIADLPREKGSYALLLHLEKPISVTVGRLGAQYFSTGGYVYTGSAMGPGGIRGRIQHYLRPNAPKHWHIDYLLEYARLSGLLYTICHIAKECDWIRVLANMDAASVINSGFGSSDCTSHCGSHLICFNKPVTLRMVWHHLSQHNPQEIIAVDYIDPNGWTEKMK